MNASKIIIAVTAILALLVVAVPAAALDMYWTAGTGSWHDAGNWDNGVPTPTVPTIDDHACIDNGGTAQISADAESSYLYAGNFNSGAVEQTGGTHTVDNCLYLGYESGSSGIYNLSGTGELSVYAREDIGRWGTGEFNQTGGTNTARSMYLGLWSDSSGTYNLSAGVLSVLQEEYIGNLDSGFNQTGGTHTVDDLFLFDGTYNLSAGQLSASGGRIGYHGTGVFNQTGGINTVGGWALGYYSGDSGTYNLSGTGQLSAGSESIGCWGTGEFNQDGGINTVTYSLNIGRTSSGTYNLSAGQLSADSEYIGFNGTGVFNQTGGTNAVGYNGMRLGHESGSSGTYNLSAGQLSARREYIGCDGTGEFNQDGGTHTIGDYLFIGYGDGSNIGTGTYNLSGTGELSTGYECIGSYHGTGEFNQDGGTNTVTYTLYLGYLERSSGEYNFYGGSLAVGDIVIRSGWMDIDISEIDAFTVSGDKVGLLDGYILDGKIFDSSSSAEIYAVYDTDNDWTTLGIGVIPEPGTIILIGSALVGLAGVLRRKLR